jgi:hypothetical protein
LSLRQGRYHATAGASAFRLVAHPVDLSTTELVAYDTTHTVPPVAVWYQPAGGEVLCRVNNRLRGERLDHEHHDMSEHRETTTADMQQAIPGLVGDIAPFDYAQGRLRQGGRFQFFFTKKLLSKQLFCKKEKEHHAAAGESGHSYAQTASLYAHRVTRVI